MFRHRSLDGSDGGIVPSPGSAVEPCFETLEPRLLLSADVVNQVLTITGTEGKDAISVKAGGAPGEVVVSKAPGVDRNSVFTGIDKIVVNGLGGDDRIAIGKNLLGVTGGMIGAEIHGGGGRDRIVGGSGDDVHHGGDGDDRISDRYGDNMVDAGEGNDRVNTGEGNDHILAGDGDDRVADRGGDNDIDGGGGDDRIKVRGGHNEIYGGHGDDSITGGHDSDMIRGGDGDDILKGDDGDDDIDGEDGDDRIIGGRGHDDLKGGPGKDRITSDAADTVEDAFDSVVQESENNDKENRADPFDLGADGTAELRGTSTNHDDKDFFKFTPDQGITLNVNVLSPNGNFAQLEITDRLDQELFETEPNNGINSGSAQLVGGKTYFVRMRSKSDNPAEYIAQLSTNGAGGGGEGGGGDPADIVDESEPNDEKAGANAFGLGPDGSVRLRGVSVNHDDKDFFRFVADQTGTLSATVGTTNGQFAQLEIEDILDNELLETQPNDGINSGTAAVTAGQTYFVRLRSPSAGPAAYDALLEIV